MGDFIRSMFRSLEVCIHERLAMIEDVLARNISDRESDLQKRVEVLEERIRSLEQKTVSPAEKDVWIDALRDLEIVLPAAPTKSQSALPGVVDAVKAEPVIKAEPVVKAEPVIKAEPVVKAEPVIRAEPVVEVEVVEEEEEVEQEEEEEVEEEVEEEEEEVVEEEEEEEEEVVEEEEVEEEGVDEITYKGKTYYKDSDNNIYNATGDELGDPIGVWDVSRQRVLFKRLI